MIRLYPNVKVQGQSFVNVKRCTVPNQSMGLREIIKRFVRRESLPIMNEGVYEERYGDLEKMAKSDITEQHESIDKFKKMQKDFKKQEKDKYDKQEEERKAKVLTDKQKSDAALLNPSPAPTTPPVSGK